MSDRSHLLEDVLLTGWLHVEVRDEHGLPRIGDEVFLYGDGFV